MSWFRRAGDSLPPLVEAPKVADLPPAVLSSGARYLGTASQGRRITARGLGGRGGSVRLVLSAEGLDVVRMSGSFRVPVSSIRGAREQDGLVIVGWTHGGQALDTAFQLSAGDAATWVRKIGKLVRKHGQS
jgi:hypothetical protein